MPDVRETKGPCWSGDDWFIPLEWWRRHEEDHPDMGLLCLMLKFDLSRMGFTIRRHRVPPKAAAIIQQGAAEELASLKGPLG